MVYYKIPEKEKEDRLTDIRTYIHTYIQTDRKAKCQPILWLRAQRTIETSLLIGMHACMDVGTAACQGIGKGIRHVLHLGTKIH